MPLLNTHKKFKKGLVWLRRDLRLEDHAALHLALQACEKVWLIFVFDKNILTPLLARNLTTDRRVAFIHASVIELDASLRALGSGLIVRYEQAHACIPQIASLLNVDAVWVNGDYEPDAIWRDEQVKAALESNRRLFFSTKDQVIFDGDEILTGAAKPFTVFTPYKNAWLRKVTLAHLEAHQLAPYFAALAPIPETLDQPIPELVSMGFTPKPLPLLAGMSGANKLFSEFLMRMEHYHLQRDFPSVRGVSYLSVHLRFGTISIRALAREAYQRMLIGDVGAQSWLSELIWRDFYFMILQKSPRLATGVSFKPAYDAIQWEEGEYAQTLFDAWCKGRTGYPLVDAAMCQINQSGFMHNRLRMVVASFLTKDLGIDWRWGERYFAEQLNDFDLSANNGGWQWAASSGCDAQPYFRIFNPLKQSEKFDSEGKFIRRYLPQLGQLPNQWIHAPWLAPSEVLESCGITLGKDYPRPIVIHDVARKKTLERYAVVKKTEQ